MWDSLKVVLLVLGLLWVLLLVEFLVLLGQVILQQMQPPLIVKIMKLKKSLHKMASAGKLLTQRLLVFIRSQRWALKRPRILLLLWSAIPRTIHFCVMQVRALVVRLTRR